VRIEQLEYVATVARLGSFRRAADELHISQPALSGSVRSLERELGVDLLDRGRHGARMSDSGRELFPYILTLLDSFDRLRHAAGEQHRSVRLVRLGTVSAATAPLLAPTIRQFRQSHPLTQVEVIGAQQAEIHRGVLEGSLDLGLVNYLDGDDMPPELETTPLLRGRPVVVLRADSQLARHAAVPTADLLGEPLIVMRSGYVMHRYLHRLLNGQPPVFSYSADGAEMGKLMVAEGLGLTVLPDFSVIGDQLEQHGVITWRPLADDHTGVELVIQRARSGSPPLAAQDLHAIFVARARVYTAAHPAAATGPAGSPNWNDPSASRPGEDGPGTRRRRGKTRVRS
jgi:DNA-binding transcriptional LysR family regulator